MLRCLRGPIGLALLLAATAGQAQAQYGYGGYGWGGWGGGGGSTVQGDYARGLGSMAFGEGLFNLNTAQANSINSDTAMRWNQANWATQHAINISYYYRRQRRRERIDNYAASTYDRLRNTPNEYDIENGDALNVALDELLNPKIYGSTIRTIRTPLSHQVIRSIPFQHASEAITVCLDSLSAKEGWPPALRTEEFKPYRDDLEKNIDNALAEDEKGDLMPETIQKVTDSVIRLNEKFEATVPPASKDYLPGKNHIKALMANAEMLHSPDVEQILAGIEKYPGTTVGDLLGFMHAFNLRFAPAKTPRQREIYQQLYPTLDGLRDKATETAAGGVEAATKNALSAASNAVGTAEKDVSSAAAGFFGQPAWEIKKKNGNNK